MSRYSSKKVAFWILLIFFSKVAFAIVQPLSAVSTSAISSETPFAHQHIGQQEHNPRLSMNSHCKHNQDSDMSLHERNHNSNCDVKCDCCIGHCTAPALFISPLTYSEKFLQHAGDQLPTSQTISPSSYLFRPPILG